MRLSKSITLQLKESKIMFEKSFNQMSLVLDTMSELVAYQDNEHKLIYVNRASAESVGKTPEELVGKYCYEIWGDGKTVCQDCPVERALWSAESQTDYIQSPDGKSWKIKGYPVKNEKGEIIGAMEVTMDITEIENLKKKMSETDRSYKFIVDNISDIVFQQDKNLKITYVSPSVEKLTGYSVEEIMNMNLLDLMTPESYKRGVENFNKYYELVKNNPEFDIPTLEYEYYGKDGRVVIGEMKVKYIFDKNGDLIGIHGVIRDVTRRKELEQQLILAQKMEALGRLAGGVAHDFNNLLTVIMGYADIALMKGGIDENTLSYFEEIKKTSKKAADLVSQLLVFSKKQIVMPRVVDINKLVENNKKMLSRVIGENIKLETYLDKNVNKIKADPTQMEQVIMNIIVNAKDAMPNGGIIKIQTGNETCGEHDCNNNIDPGEYIYISISDTGCGMSENVKSHIFEPFFSTKTDQKGTGLGLSTAFGIIKQNKGCISVESQKDKGSTFKIYLPAYEGSDVDDAIVEKKKLHNAKVKGKKILVVEDEASVRDMVSEILLSNGYIVLKAKDGEEAKEMLTKNKIDFVVSDVIMPRMDGKELYKHVRENSPDIRFLFMSGYMDNDVLLKDIKNEKVNFIKKPFAPQDLLIKVSNILKSSALNQF
ncbi:MAG: hypothetical protein DRP55_06540 [Spirochaetes bacterium]|nr:MAG: hypothetical protein DRP55_06540 [Spirochaetota bacterium]